MLVPRFAAALALVLVHPAQAQERTRGGYPFQPAPDGRPGLGVAAEARAIAKLFRDPEGQERTWLRGLFDLAMDVETHVAVAEARYRRLGYFEVFDRFTLEGARAGLGRLHATRQSLSARPFERVWSPEAGAGLARLLTDETFVLRAPLLEAARAEVQEFRAGLRLFEALAEGNVRFDERDILDTLTRRFDLSTARLRALRLDLEALGEPVGAPVPEPDAELLAALRAGDASRGTLRLRSLRSSSPEQVARRRASLSSSRFDADHLRELEDRRVGRVTADRELRRILRLLPFVGVDQEEPPEDMKQIDLHREAVAAGLEALRGNPLAPDVYYLLGVALDFCQGRNASTPYFDAFLALRGVRHWQHHTFADRDLNAAERYALWVVAGWRPPRSKD